MKRGKRLLSIILVSVLALVGATVSKITGRVIGNVLMPPRSAMPAPKASPLEQAQRDSFTFRLEEASRINREVVKLCEDVSDGQVTASFAQVRLETYIQQYNDLVLGLKLASPPLNHEKAREYLIQILSLRQEQLTELSQYMRTADRDRLSKAQAYDSHIQQAGELLINELRRLSGR